MKTLIISTSLNPDSLSLKCCLELEKKWKEKKDNVELINLQDFEISHVHGKKSRDEEKIKNLCEEADSFIFGIAVYNYNVNDSFTSFVSNYLPQKKFAPYGLVLAAGGNLSFLVTSAANQMLMTHNQMIPFPRFLYTTKEDWNESVENPIPEFSERIESFAQEFSFISGKLLKK